MDKAIESGAPIVGLIDSGGARIQEGVDSLSGYGSIFHRNVMSSGVIPQISVMMGPAAGGATYSPALTDFIFMVEGLGQMYITGPDVIRAVTSEDISHEDLGGTEAHTVKSGVAHFAEETEESCIARVQELLSYLPQNNMEDSPLTGNSDSPDRYSDNLNSLKTSRFYEKSSHSLKDCQLLPGFLHLQSLLARLLGLHLQWLCPLPYRSCWLQLQIMNHPEQ
jgi:acetyl-CoA carboxylase carboxyltransferase component